MAVEFKDLQDNYPNEPRAKLFENLGPDWLPLVSNPNYDNTCSIRLSVALLRAGLAIKKKYREALTERNENIVLRVKTMGQLVQSNFGDPWGMSKEVGVPLKSSDIPARTGIIAYHVNWKDATGHFDLWHGTGFVGSGNFDDVADGYDIALWFIS